MGAAARQSAESDPRARARALAAAPLSRAPGVKNLRLCRIGPRVRVSRRVRPASAARFDSALSPARPPRFGPYSACSGSLYSCSRRLRLSCLAATPNKQLPALFPFRVTVLLLCRSRRVGRPGGKRGVGHLLSMPVFFFPLRGQAQSAAQHPRRLRSIAFLRSPAGPARASSSSIQSFGRLRWAGPEKKCSKI